MRIDKIKKMKKLTNIFPILTAMLFLSLLTSCGEDRSGEYEALIGQDKWIYETMSQYYLWYADMPTKEEKDYFTDAETFFKSLLSTKCRSGKGDSFSYIEEMAKAATRSLHFGKSSTYGFDFILYEDPTGVSTHKYARIIYVASGSPAEQAKLARGQWIEAIDGTTLTTDNYTGLINGTGTSLSIVSLVNNNGTYSWKKEGDYKVGASRAMEDNPFYVDSVYTVGGKKIAYLMYNSFSTGPTDAASEIAYGDQMKKIFLKFKSAQPDAFILDLRYNPGGYVTMAQKLASLMVLQASLGKTFCSLEYNDKNQSLNTTYPLDATYASDANLNLGKVYILTGQYTASASELVINGLIPYLGKDNVVLVGATTVGKNVASKAFSWDTNNKYTIYPIVATCYNSAHSTDYESGFAPTYTVDEIKNFDVLQPLGSTNELLLSYTIGLITNPGTTTASSNISPYINRHNIVTGFCSLQMKQQNGVLIK